MDLKQRVHSLTVEYPGVQAWLRHGHDEGLWGLTVIGNDPVDVPPADLYLLGGLHPVYHDILPHLRKAGGKVAVAWASSAGEMDFTKVELENVFSLMRAKPGEGVDAWACLHPDVVGMFPNGHYLPAPIHMEEELAETTRSGIGLFGPPTLKKNVLNQLLGVRQAQREGAQGLTLHTNMTAYKPVIEALGINATYYEWTSRSEYLATLAKLRAVLAVSHAESWHYGAVDAMMMGCEVVCSGTVRSAEQAGAYIVEDPNSPTQIRDSLLEVVDPQQRIPIGPRERIATLAQLVNIRAAKAVQELLDAVGGSKH